DRIAVLDGNVGEHTGGRRRHFDGNFIGFQFDERFVDGNRVARLLEPFADRSFGHRLAEGGYANLRHGNPLDVLMSLPGLSRPSTSYCRAPPKGREFPAHLTGGRLPPNYYGQACRRLSSPSLSPRKFFGCAGCRDFRPPAVEPAAARPASRARRCLAPIWLSTH